MPGWSRIDYAGEIPYREIGNLLGGALGGIAVCAPFVNYTNALSTKVFDYMAAGIAVISSDFPGWREVVDAYQCTIFIDGTKPRAIADAILSLAENPDSARALGAKGQRAVTADLNLGEGVSDTPSTLCTPWGCASNARRRLNFKDIFLKIES